MLFLEMIYILKNIFLVIDLVKSMNLSETSSKKLKRKRKIDDIANDLFKSYCLNNYTKSKAIHLLPPSVNEFLQAKSNMKKEELINFNGMANQSNADDKNSISFSSEQISQKYIDLKQASISFDFFKHSSNTNQTKTVVPGNVQYNMETSNKQSDQENDFSIRKIDDYGNKTPVNESEMATITSNLDKKSNLEHEKPIEFCSTSAVILPVSSNLGQKKDQISDRKIYYKKELYDFDSNCIISKYDDFLNVNLLRIFESKEQFNMKDLNLLREFDKMLDSKTRLLSETQFILNAVKVNLPNSSGPPYQISLKICNFCKFDKQYNPEMNHENNLIAAINKLRPKGSYTSGVNYGIYSIFKQFHTFLEASDLYEIYFDLEFINSRKNALLNLFNKYKYITCGLKLHQKLSLLHYHFHQFFDANFDVKLSCLPEYYSIVYILAKSGIDQLIHANRTFVIVYYLLLFLNSFFEKLDKKNEITESNFSHNNYDIIKVTAILILRLKFYLSSRYHSKNKRKLYH